MKKILSVVLAVLMMFSVCSVAFAGDKVTVTFYDYDNTVIDQIEVVSGEVFDGPVNAPERASAVVNGTEYEYIFKGWAKLENGVPNLENLENSALMDPVTADTQYIAVYSESVKQTTTTFWNLIEMIFAKFNMIFEYFYKIFG